jgi:shikimate dehydrogenase
LNLALIGKNIQHSQSKNIYKKLISKEFNYDFLDVQSESELPSLSVLKNKYFGLNITSPYKRFYYKDVIMNQNIKKIGAINCIKFENENILATNTDFLAMKVLITQFLPFDNVIILGSGVMAQVTAHLLNESKTPYKFFSRKLKNLGNLNQYLEIVDQNTLVINALAREVTINFEKDLKIKFWDLNYGINEHDQYLSKRVRQYVNGESLLFEQAKLAVEFWGL